MRSGWLPAGLFFFHIHVSVIPLRADLAAQHASSSLLKMGIDIVVVTYLAFGRRPVRR
jgi:hypothetical protein